MLKQLLIGHRLYSVRTAFCLLFRLIRAK